MLNIRRATRGVTGVAQVPSGFPKSGLRKAPNAVPFVFVPEALSLSGYPVRLSRGGHRDYRVRTGSKVSEIWVDGHSEREPDGRSMVQVDVNSDSPRDGARETAMAGEA